LYHPIDYRDLADVVQRLRMIGWRASLGPAKVGVHVPWFEDLHEFPAYVAALDALAMLPGERGDEARMLAAETRRIHEALVAGPKRPTADDVIARFVGGEIGDRTVRYVMDWDAFQVAEECVKRGLPPWQDVDQDSPDDHLV
jgi:hypothetical protein